MKKKYGNLANTILEHVGGKKNISYLTHCLTRLRFNLKDKNLVNVAAIEGLSEIIGTKWQGEQFQVIIGQHVGKVYEGFSGMENVATKVSIDLEDEVKEKLSLKSIGNQILRTLSNCLTPLIPILIVAAMFKTIIALLGPNMLNFLSDTNDIYVLLNFVADAAFYFFPVSIGYTSARHFKVSPILGMFLGMILISPSFIQLAESGDPFSIFGVYTIPQNYSGSIIPIILSVWVMSYIEKFLSKYCPAVLASILVPTITILVMLPLSFLIFGPAGMYIGNIVNTGLLSLGDLGGIWAILAMGIIGALYQFLILTGMHWLLISSMTVLIAQAGSEALITPPAFMAGFTVSGMCLGAVLRLKNKKEKTLGVGYIISQMIGGVTEPGLYGIGLKYKKPLIGMMVGGFTASVYAGLVGLTGYQFFPLASVLALLVFAGGSVGNFVQGIIAAVIGFVVAAVVTYFVGIDEDFNE